jgi:O-antigen/teichoic acid export membrane protein
MIKSLTGSVAWYSAGNIFIRSASFLLLPLYSNLITPVEFGIYSVIMSFYAVFSVLFQGGLQSAISKFYIERDEKTEIFSVIINIIVAWGALIVLSVFIFSSFYSKVFFNTDTYSGLFQLITVSLYIETIVFFILHLFKTQEEAFKAVIYSSAGAALNILLNVVFVYIYNQGIEGIIKAQLYSTILTLIILLPYFKANYKFDLQRFFKTSYFKPLIFFSIPVFLSGLFSALVDVADRFIINDLLGEQQTGIYSFAYRIAMVMNIFVISFRTAFTPFSINLYSTGDYSKRLGNVLLNLISIGAVIVMSVSFFADDLFDLKLFDVVLFTPEYKSGIIILPYILTGYFFSAMMSFYSLYPYISGKSYHFLFSDFLSFGVNIVMNLVLIPTAGIVGAALATLFAFLTGAVYLYTVSAGRIKIDYDRNKIAIVLLSAVILLNFGLYMDYFFLDIILVGIFCVILIASGGINLSLLRLKAFNKTD